MSAGLSRQELMQFKAQLQARESQLLGELQSGKRRAAAETFERIAGEAPDAGDASVADTTRDVVNAERERDADELREVQAALDRIDAGTYGVCLTCGELIDRQRLRAFPTARYDAGHQARHEQKQGIATRPKL
jgi:RNA polymerase-binding transcription factor DksA